MRKPDPDDPTLFSWPDGDAETFSDGDRRFGAVFENGALGIALCDLRGRILKANHAFATLCGYAPDDLVGVYCLRLTHPDDVERERPLMEALFAGRTEHYQLEKRMVRSDGTPFWVLMARSLVRDKAGTPQYAIVMLIDINERREAEALLRERDEQLQRAQRLEAVGQLARGIAHDFNNLLMPIIGNATLLLSELPPGHPDAEMLTDIKEAGERAAVLTKQILAFSRGQTLDVWPAQLNDIVSGLEPILRGVLGADVELELSLQAGLHETKLDRHEMEQVLVNLAVNSRDAMPDGGRFTVETTEVRLQGQARDLPELLPGDYVRITVADTGTGMDEDALKHAFEPFYTTKEVGKGTGLGLATVFGIVKQSGGAITVTSEPGKGTTFHIYLPVDMQAGDPARPEGGPAGDPVRALKILVLEDEAKVRNLVGRVLRGAGYDVFEAGSWSELDEVIPRVPGTPDLLLTDVVLPGGRNGRQVAAGIRERFPGIPVVYMSGYSRESAVDSQFEAGAEILEKPFAPDALLERVKAALGTA